MALTANSVRGVFSKVLTDNTATAVFTITTPTSDAAAAGAYSCHINLMVANGYSASTHGATSSKGLVVCFTRNVIRQGPAGATSAVVELCETGSAATSSANRDLGTVTVTVTEISEFKVQVEVTADGTGALAVALIAMCSVEVLWAGFASAPVLAQA